MILVDKRGNELVVGAKVYYNLGGAVARGEIQAIKPGVEMPGTAWRWLEPPVVWIAADPEWRTLAAKGGVSVCKIKGRHAVRYRDGSQAVGKYLVDKILVETEA